MEVQEQYRFETVDRERRVVRYREAIYQRHLRQHPEMAEYVEEAKQTVNDPDCITSDDDGGRDYQVYYRFGLGRGKHAKCFIKVPVYYHRTLWGEVGEVATFHLTRRIGTGRAIWTRPSR